jgi:outer membrane receptor protein involved in Fe transport
MTKYKLILFALLFPSILFAQESQSFSLKELVLLTDTIKLNEIIIEASKTADNLQEIQTATSLIPAKVIEEQGLNSLTDLSARIPNFFMPDYGSRLTSPIYIRGVGSRISSPSVGLYVDDIPYFDKGSFNFEFFDVEKIEVLRGPQGTLYGRNTMAGIIKVYTPQPKFRNGGKVKVEYGTENHIKTALQANIKLSDKLAFIAGGAFAHSDGYFTNAFTNKAADNYDLYNGNFKLRYTPTARFNMILSANFEKNKQMGYPYGIYDIDTQEVADVNYNDESTYDRSLISIGLRMEYHLENVILSSSSSFQHMEDFQGIDQDFTPATLFWVIQDRTENTFVEEFTIRNKNEGKLDWLAGAFAFTQLNNKLVGLTYGADAIANPRYRLTGPTNYTKLYDQPSTGIAAYGQLSYTFGKFKATAGIRADYETSTFDYDYELFVNDNSVKTDAIDNTMSFSKLMPKASFSYHPTENVTIFTSVSNGYKAGGFNTSFSRDENDLPIDATFKAEESINYELGFKSIYFNNRLISNFNIFYTTIENQQIYQPIPSGFGSMLKNAGKSSVRGIEAEFRYLINEHHTVWASYGSNKAIFDKYVRSETLDYSGNSITYVPKYTLNIGTNYTLKFRSNKVRNATLTLNYQQMGKLFWNDANTAYQESYGILNGRINFHSSKFDFGIWGKNLLDTDYNAFYFEALGNSYAQAGKPIQYGVFINFNI